MSKKKSDLLRIALCALLVVVFFVFLFPWVRVMGARLSPDTKNRAQEMIQAYQAESQVLLDQKDVVRDLSYLSRWDTLRIPDRIAGQEDGRIVYAMEFSEDYTELVDVEVLLPVTFRYHIREENGPADNLIEVKPWGTSCYVDGKKI